VDKGGLYLCMNTVDGIAHILRGRHNHGECEKDETGDTPVEPEHFAGRVKTRCHKIPLSNLLLLSSSVQANTAVHCVQSVGS
jgi:hypothetical protein